ERRPQSAAELRRRLEACSVAPWDDEHAQAWWRQYRDQLVEDERPVSDPPRTMIVDQSRINA
ncbi:MAG TPA: hypothetical protein VGC79_36130, partial [Polyangiaceae bacterium]